MEKNQKVVNDILDSMEYNDDEKIFLSELIHRLIDDNIIVDYTEHEMKSLNDLERELYVK